MCVCVLRVFAGSYSVLLSVYLLQVCFCPDAMKTALLVLQKQALFTTLKEFAVDSVIRSKTPMGLWNVDLFAKTLQLCIR